MPQENQKSSETPNGSEFYIVGPDRKVYQNPHNLPLENIQKFMKFKNGGPIFRFAFDPQTASFYIQDQSWRNAINSGDKDAHEILNSALSFLSKKYKDVKQVNKKFGDPEDSASLSKLSAYGIAWDYISDFLKREFSKTEKDAKPIDASVVECFLEKDSEPVVLHQDGFKFGNVDSKGPTFVVNKNKVKRKDGSVDYGLINHFLVTSYMRNFKNLSKDAYQDYLKTMNPTRFTVFFAGYSKDGAQVHKASEEQSSHVQNEASLRQTLRKSTCNECGQSYGSYRSECEKCHSKSLTYGPEYTGPLALFTYMPERKQILFQNHRPQDMEYYGYLKELLDKIKSSISGAYGVDEKDLVLSYDPSPYIPFVSSMSKYQTVWTYITKIMCPKNGIKPIDIPVVEMPMEGNTMAGFVSSPAEENEKTNGEGVEYRISQGISVPYPFILVNLKMTNIGLRYSAMIHEYKHFLDYSTGNLESDRIDGLPDDGSKFLEYIRRPREQRAHLDQMIHCLSMGMKPQDILSMFAPKDNMLAMSEYSKILNKAIEEYDKVRFQKQAPEQGMPQKTAASSLDSTQIPAVMDWWNLEIQSPASIENIVDEAKAAAKREALRNVAFEGLEALVTTKHDKELGAMKSIEQLLAESRV